MVLTTCIKAAQRAKRRARKMASTIVDHGLTWQLVMASDGPECYLCGFDVNPDDFTYRLGVDGRGAFVAGPEYPSLDHVTALARGGDHSLANARLAHCLCNSLKNDRPLEEVA